MKTSEQGTTDQAYFTDSNSPNVAAGRYVDGTLAALSGWGDVLIGPESVGLTPDGRVDRIDVGTTADGDNGTGGVQS